MTGIGCWPDEEQWTFDPDYFIYWWLLVVPSRMSSLWSSWQHARSVFLLLDFQSCLIVPPGLFLKRIWVTVIMRSQFHICNNSFVLFLEHMLEKSRKRVALTVTDTESDSVTLCRTLSCHKLCLQNESKHASMIFTKKRNQKGLNWFHSTGSFCSVFVILFKTFLFF